MKADLNPIKIQKSFFPSTATFLLRLMQAPEIPHSIRNFANKHHLFQKKEFHLTVIGSKTGKEILKLSRRNEVDYLQELQKLINEWTFQIYLLDKYLYISKSYPQYNNENRKAVIRLAKIIGLKEFYEKINILFPFPLKTPFPHLTLFTYSSNLDNIYRGIGIYSEKDLELLSVMSIGKNF